MERGMIPTVKGMAAEGRHYKGVLYAGLMIKAGEVRVLEFNARFGDPEAQPLLIRMESDLVPILEAGVEGRLHEKTIEWKPDPSVCVVMASAGYPGPYEKGIPISGLREAAAAAGVFGFRPGPSPKKS